jgi:hypothetical protein
MRITDAEFRAVENALLDLETYNLWTCNLLEKYSGQTLVGKYTRTFKPRRDHEGRWIDDEGEVMYRMGGDEERRARQLMLFTFLELNS